MVASRNFRFAPLSWLQSLLIGFFRGKLVTLLLAIRNFLLPKRFALVSTEGAVGREQDSFILKSDRLYQPNYKHQPLNGNPGKLHEHTLEQKTSPLNAVRLKPRRCMIKEQNAVLHISEDKQVVVEVLKDRKRKLYVSEVMVISTDGMKIKMYKPKKIPLDNDLPPPLPSDPNEIGSYDFQNLPKIYYRWYLIAKQFVDTLRARQPRLTSHGKNATIYWMENSPDPDIKMEFYDGGRVIKRGRKIIITNNLGKTCDANDPTKHLDDDFNSMLEEFQKEKQMCERFIQHLELSKLDLYQCTIGIPKNESDYLKKILNFRG